MYDVFIDGPVDRTPAGHAKLATAISQRFRLPESQVQTYLTAGKLKAKGNIDEGTARALASQLEQLGALVSIVDKVSGAVLQRGSGTIQSQPPPVNPAAPVPVPPGSAPRYESGLAAAFGPQAAQMSLGALEHLSVSSLDGKVSHPPAKPSTPPAPRAPAAAGSSSAVKPAAKPAPAASSARDPFAPPDESEEPPLELADSPARPSGKAKPSGPMAPPPPTPPPPRPAPSTQREDPFAPPDGAEEPVLDLAESPAKPAAKAKPSGTMAPPPPAAVQAAAPARSSPQAPDAPAAQARKPVGLAQLREHFGDNPLQRLVAGLVLGLAIGFLPAHVYATMAEDKYDRINGDFAREPAPGTQAEYEILLSQYDYTVKRLHNERTKIAITTGLVWALFGCGAGFAWFRYVIPQP